MRSSQDGVLKNVNLSRRSPREDDASERAGNAGQSKFRAENSAPGPSGRAGQCRTFRTRGRLHCTACVQFKVPASAGPTTRPPRGSVSRKGETLLVTTARPRHGVPLEILYCRGSPFYFNITCPMYLFGVLYGGEAPPERANFFFISNIKMAKSLA